MNFGPHLAARVQRALLIGAMLALLISLIGCGAGRTASAPPIDDTLFVPNYVSTLNGSLYHWDYLPVRVGFTLPTNWQQLYPASPTLHFDAANEWNQPGKHALVSVVAPGVQADAEVVFVPQSELGGNNQGLTEYTHDSTGRMRDATIKVALDTRHGGWLSAADVQSTIAHEIGHAVGIGGHSPNPEDLMYPTLMLGAAQTATARDLNTAMTAYPGFFTRSIVPETRAPVGPVTIRTDTI